MGDLDGDGDLDLLAGGYYGNFVYFENTGSATSPAFVQPGGDPPLSDEDLGYHSTPSLGDFDFDGDLDVLAGEEVGVISYSENAGDASTPLFSVSLSNPFGLDVDGGSSASAAGDLDGDGDLDLVTGNGDGTFAVHYFPEPARALLLGAGTALLSLVDRFRRRRS